MTTLFSILFFIFTLVPTVAESQTADLEFLYKEGEFSVAGINDRRFCFYDHIYKSPVENNIKIKTLKHKKLLFGKMTVYYPEIGGNYPLIILSHGWGDGKAANAAMARHLATHGFVTAVFSSKKRKKPEDWLPVLSVAFELVFKEANNNSSPLFKKINFDKLGLLGHSMGGTAALHYSNIASNNISSVIALHPYNGGKGIVSKIGGENEVLGDVLISHSADSLILTGTQDTIALPEKSFAFFTGIESSKKTVFMLLASSKHNYPVEGVGNPNAGTYNSEAHKIYRMLVTAWCLATLKPEYKHSTFSAKLFSFKSFEFNLHIKPLLKSIDGKNCPAFISK